MTYILPDDVKAPDGVLKNLEVLYHGKEGDYALARGEWNGKSCRLIRWNGKASTPVGYPQSNHQPTWFVLPDELSDAVDALLNKSK